MRCLHIVVALSMVGLTSGLAQFVANRAYPETIAFEDSSSDSGIDFVLQNGASVNKYQIETMAGGVGIIDFNNDGRPDIYFANGASLPSLEKASPKFYNRLYENLGNDKFRDVTIKAGVQGYGFCTGVAIADFDGDGFQDIFVACYPRNILYRNRGDGTFEDVTIAAGVSSPKDGAESLWSVAAAWLDYNRDGLLDLFVSNYCNWTPMNNPYCGNVKKGIRIYCDPRQFRAQPNTLYQNLGTGHFRDVSRETGVAASRGYNMGLAVADYKRNGWPDVFVANDTSQNVLFDNQDGHKFLEVALTAGVGLPQDGQAVSGMGVDFRDFDNDGYPDIFMTALSSQTWPLFRNIEDGEFDDITFSSGTGRYSVGLSGWSNGIVDLDNDGWKDLLAVQSHATDNSESLFGRPYLGKITVFANVDGLRFREAGANAGVALQTLAAYRGCAFADFDNDGRIDVIVTALGQKARLLHNVSTPANHWIGVRLTGKNKNHDAVGAEIKITDSNGRSQYNQVTTSVGYASSSDLLVHFGLGSATAVVRLVVRWPDGAVGEFPNVPIDRVNHFSER